MTGRFEECSLPFFVSNRLTEGQGVSSIGGAGTGVDVVRELVGLGAGSVTGGTGDGVAGLVVNADGETSSDDRGLILEVDAGHVPEEEVADLGVLVLEDIVEVIGAAELDGDTAAGGVDLPGLLVGLAGGEDLHGGGALRDRPDEDVLSQVVDDGDTAVDATANVVHRQGRGSSQSGGNAEDLAEEHFERVVVVVWKRS